VYLLYCSFCDAAGVSDYVPLVIGLQECVQKEAVVMCEKNRPWRLSEGTGINLETCNTVQTVLWPIVEQSIYSGLERYR
jgi:hypothetical protein